MRPDGICAEFSAVRANERHWPCVIELWSRALAVALTPWFISCSSDDPLQVAVIVPVDSSATPLSAQHSVALVDDHTACVIVSYESEVRCVDRTGELVGVFGGEGDGPGEFRFARALLRGPRRTVAVIDPLASRISVFKPTGELVAEVAVPEMFEPMSPIDKTVIGTYELSLAPASSVSAQNPELVSGEVVCSSCRIVLDTVATIGGLDGPASHLIGRYQSHVAVDGRGRILVSSVLTPEIGVFDASGSFVRTVGRRGEGPGEYQAISMVVPGPSHIHVFDYGRGRTVLDYEFNVVRVDRFPGQVIAAVVRNGDEVVFNADVGTPSAVGHQFHILSPAGQMASFGASGAVYYGRSPHSFGLAGDGENTIWTVRTDANIVTRWELEPEPRVTRAFVRHVESFEKDSPSQPRYPRAGNVDAMLDGSGLWIVWSTPDPDWTDRQPPETPMPDVPPRIRYDGLLDLVDTATGRTIARLRNDGEFGLIAPGSRYIVAYHETDEGIPYLHLLNPRLVRDGD